MGSFPLFSNFPIELQLAVWEFAAIQPEPPEPEVCIAWPLDIEDDERGEPAEDPVLPFTVDTAWPGIAHACHASREAFLASGAVGYSPTAALAVPYRRFIPTIDTLYWGQAQVFAMLNFFNRPWNLHIAQDLCHLAVELNAAAVAMDRIGELIRLRATCIRTVSIVVPGTMDSPSYKRWLGFLPPARRCRLRDIPNETLNEVRIGMFENDKNPIPLQEYLHERRGAIRLRNPTRGRAVPWWAEPEDTARNTEDDCFVGLEIKAQTFVEYAFTNNQVQWVEVCQDRVLDEDSGWPHPGPRRIAAADRKDPEKYRVLDDDSAMLSREEYVAELVRRFGVATCP